MPRLCEKHGDKPKLQENERYPKIFSAVGIFDNAYVDENYVINFASPFNAEILKEIAKAIYQNDLQCNNYKYLKTLES